MEKHERGCTANPNRICGLHLKPHSRWREPQKPLSELTKIVAGATQEDIDSRIPTLRDASGLWPGGCPACILAALRQGAPGVYSTFNFKEEMKKFWDEMNSERETGYDGPEIY